MKSYDYLLLCGGLSECDIERIHDQLQLTEFCTLNSFRAMAYASAGRRLTLGMRVRACPQKPRMFTVQTTEHQPPVAAARPPPQLRCPAAVTNALRQLADEKATAHTAPNLICAICHENERRVVLGCSHTFCAACTQKVAETSALCPDCRAPIQQVKVFICNAH